MPVDADKPWSVNLIDVPALVARAARVVEVAGDQAPESTTPPTPTCDAPAVVPRTAG